MRFTSIDPTGSAERPEQVTEPTTTTAAPGDDGPADTGDTATTQAGVALADDGTGGSAQAPDGSNTSDDGGIPVLLIVGAAVVALGGVVSPHYDPMIAKIVAHGPTRDDARRKLASALRDTTLLGVVTNKEFLANICENALKYGRHFDSNDAIEIRTGRIATTDRPMLEVLDRGPGIHASDAERIFDGHVIGRHDDQADRALAVDAPQLGRADAATDLRRAPQRRRRFRPPRGAFLVGRVPGHGRQQPRRVPACGVVPRPKWIVERA